MRIHPAADIFPRLVGPDLEALTEDIRSNGLRHPVVLLGDQLLDGRNRIAACEAASVPIRTEVAPKNTDPIAYVLSANLHRRHLDESQRAMVGARVREMYEESAKERQREGGRLKGSANLREAGKASVDAAKAVNVSPRSVEAASKVLKEAAPEVVKAVDAGLLAVSAAADLAEEPEREQRAVVAKISAGKMKSHQVRTDLRRNKRTAKIVELAAREERLSAKKKYAVLLADPPWQYEHSESDSRAIENQYPTMDIEKIRELPVSDIALPDAILFLWATAPKLEEALLVLSAWGFSYRTCAVWDKQKIGMGYYFRQQTELLLVATRGELPVPRPEDRPSSLIQAPRGRHSEKPAEVYALIERMYPTLPRIELFARTTRAGWDRWGNEAKRSKSA